MDKKKIFLLNRDTDLCLLLKAYLLRKGNDVYTGQNLAESLATIRELQPDLIYLSAAVSFSPEDLEKLKKAAPFAEIIVADGGQEYDR